MPAKTKGALNQGSTQASGLAQSCLHKQLRKTKFCMFHLQGACQFGKDCAFAHSLAEMSGMPDLRKTQLCKAFADGKCQDPNCNFAHGEVELRSTDMFFKKSLCIWNEKGKCRNGSQCRFAHGMGELRSSLGQHITDHAQATGTAPQTPTSSPKSHRRKGKEQGMMSRQTTASDSGSKLSQQKPPGLEFTVPVSPSDSSSNSGSLDNVSTHISSPGGDAREPMKVLPRSVNLQKSGTDFSDISFAPMATEAHLMQQQEQDDLQHQWLDAAGKLEELQQWQESLIHRLVSLEGAELAMDASYWQMEANNYYSSDAFQDLHNSFGMQMNPTTCKTRPYMYGTLSDTSIY